ncbi:glycine zipper 2TM domain-containing protein [Comamonas sp. NLF-1-9]|uniref:glycine zipper 2TM domain-containing protein n=1 Tax=Comamonas sp. NLF-1-9 TaxID=2853163 RepID=UPI001C4617B9|nr:glycine zipper 2TM domain-containing protein [Comamonas sp. NLF-1-9]QXL85555.1 glycine zipper 2TM domain-containing protein [Comamonas sp. NLF-1-9]
MLTTPHKHFTPWARRLALSLACVGALGISACSSSPTNAQIGTGVGAVVGGAAGNVIFGGPVGTIGGAAAGALVGHEVGKNQRKR